MVYRIKDKRKEDCNEVKELRLGRLWALENLARRRNESGSKRLSRVIVRIWKSCLIRETQFKNFIAIY